MSEPIPKPGHRTRFPAGRRGIAILGCGKILQDAHLPAYQQHGLDVVGVTHLIDKPLPPLTGTTFDDVPHMLVVDHLMHWLDITRCWLGGKDVESVRLELERGETTIGYALEGQWFVDGLAGTMAELMLAARDPVEDGGVAVALQGVHL